MNTRLILGLLLLGIGSFQKSAAQPAAAVATSPVYVPDYTHANDPLPSGVLNWDATQKSVDATNGQDFARFIFYFTNVAAKVDSRLYEYITRTTNFAVVTNTGMWSVMSGNKYSTGPAVVSTRTNFVTVTNSLVKAPITILSVHPSCGCTTAELPPTPWMLPPGTNSTIKVNVNIAGKSGTLAKYVTVTTDKGKLDLHLTINILPGPPPRGLTDSERAMGVAAAKIDRQAVFKGDCASCHAKNVQGLYSQQLFAAVCAVCHEANPRATMVPDLHHVKDQTSEEFWRAWITAGKPGTLMPAFAVSQGGPLSDMQIASLAAWLNYTIPPHPPETDTK